MALSFTDVQRINIKASGGLRMAVIDITLDGTYPTGGWPITAANLGWSGISMIIPVGKGAGRVFEWDTANAKLQAREAGTAAAVLPEIGAAEATGTVVRCFCVGY